MYSKRPVGGFYASVPLMVVFVHIKEAPVNAGFYMCLLTGHMGRTLPVCL